MVHCDCNSPTFTRIYFVPITLFLHSSWFEAKRTKANTKWHMTPLNVELNKLPSIIRFSRLSTLVKLLVQLLPKARFGCVCKRTDCISSKKTQYPESSIRVAASCFGYAVLQLEQGSLSKLKGRWS